MLLVLCKSAAARVATCNALSVSPSPLTTMDILLRLMTGSIVAIFTFVRYMKIILFFYRKYTKVSPITNNVLKISASKVAEKIRNREIKSYDLVNAYIQRVKEVNPTINCVAEDRFEAALQDAKKVDLMLDDDNVDLDELRRTKPLLGLPITIKENLPVQGLSSTLCSKIRIGFKAEEDCDVVVKVKAAGAIPILVSTTPEFCMCMETYSKVFGISNNPYNTMRTTGGSSGGEGALLASGASLIGVGSDLAGSIRFPSAFNGIFGHKPTHGYIPTNGSLPESDNEEFNRYLAIGPMVRYPEDLRLMMNVLGENMGSLKLNEKVDLSKIRVFFMEDCKTNFGLVKVQREIKQAIRDSVRHLKDKCQAEISDKKFQNLGLSPEMCSAASSTLEYVSPLRAGTEKFWAVPQLLINAFSLSRFCEYTMVHDILDTVTKWTPKRKVKKYFKVIDELREEMAESLRDNGVFLYPVYPTTAQRHKEWMLGYASIYYAFIVNILGFPSTTVPIGCDRKGLPVAIQVIANMNQDRLCLAVAEELGEAFGGWIPPSN
ncbi:PREDICTED: fatty-acid amide hydrolase 2-B-like [Nicrophorus vespilloides]|uniref:Fatty-acid amide hydrolase 2-B-like n=1 Tax=Nicrophorus vespilloides TaxID=110193 RepID=A0ABM1N9G9_NICVS|nr:PREDICTED: fatty-acid amide hydrolase 2-B-like [Nicrophorus vespilloides]